LNGLVWVISHIPNAESAFQTSRKYATHPHLAGSTADFEDAKTLLSLFQTEFHIRRPHTEPVFPAGSKESRDATLGLTSKPALGRKKKKGPTAWIDVYYPVLNTPLNRSLSIVNDQGSVEWEADLEEEGDMRDPEANMYRTSVPVWHGLSKDGDITGELVYANYGNQEVFFQRFFFFMKTGFEVTDAFFLNRIMHNLLPQGRTLRVKLFLRVMEVSSVV